MEPIHIQLCSSQCGRNEFYLRRIDETARRLGLDYCLEQVNLARTKPLGGWFYPLAKYGFCGVTVLVLIVGAIMGGIG